VLPLKHFALTFHFTRPLFPGGAASKLLGIFLTLISPAKESQWEQPRPLVKPFSCRGEKRKNYADSARLQVKISAHICAKISNARILLKHLKVKGKVNGRPLFLLF